MAETVTAVSAVQTVAAQLRRDAEVQREAALRTANKLYRDISNLILDIQNNRRPSTMSDGAMGLGSDATSIERQVFAWLNLAQQAEHATHMARAITE